MESMFSHSNLSLLNYNSLLIGWSQLDLQSGVNFDAVPTQYGSRAADARQYIITTFGWTITDNGLDPVPVFTSTPSDFVYINGSSNNHIHWEISDNNPWLYNITRNWTLFIPPEEVADQTQYNAIDWSNAVEGGQNWVGTDFTGTREGIGVHNFTLFLYDKAGQMASDSVIVTIVPYTDTGESSSVDPGDPSTDGDATDLGLPFSPLYVLIGTLIMIPMLRKNTY